MASIEKAVAWAIEIANDDTHGYDQEHRNGPDYDCSSFVGTALNKGGFNVNPSMTTASAYAALTKVGFTVIAMNAERQLGDIFLVYNSAHHHIVMCINATQIVHASINELGTVVGGQTGDQTGNEICVRDFYTPSGGWSYHFRAPASSEVSTTWYAGNRYLSESEKQHNAKLTYAKLHAYGWTLNAIAAALGNLDRESTINPGIWQNLDKGNVNLGYGLAQWTPAGDKILAYCEEHGYSKTNGDYQLKYLHEETDKLHYWVDRGYPLTFTEFQKSTESPEYLALAFCYNYENAGVTADEERKQNARKWYDYLLDYDPGTTPPVDPTDPDVPDVPESSDEDHMVVIDPDSPDMKHPDYEYYNNIYRQLQKTSYNTNKLTSAEIKKFKWMITTDRVTLPATFDRNKRTFGYDFYRKHLHMVHNDYQIVGMRKNGFLVLRYRNEETVIYIEPKRIGVVINDTFRTGEVLRIM